MKRTSLWKLTKIDSVISGPNEWVTHVIHLTLSCVIFTCLVPFRRQIGHVRAPRQRASVMHNMLSHCSRLFSRDGLLRGYPSSPQLEHELLPGHFTHCLSLSAALSPLLLSFSSLSFFHLLSLPPSLVSRLSHYVCAQSSPACLITILSCQRWFLSHIAFHAPAFSGFFFFFFNCPT